MDIVYISLLLLLAKSYGERLEIPAYEYLKRFEQPLTLGQCPDRFVTYQWGHLRERCTYPNRAGNARTRFKKVDYAKNTVLHNVEQLFKQFSLCDRRAANYLGILNKGDCVAATIAGKLSFKSRTSTRLYLDHYRPIMNTLNPSDELNIPAEFTAYVNNSFYTENIGIGTEEVLIMELTFATEDEARKADRIHLGSSKLLSEYVKYIGVFVGRPKKIKVIRHSTAEQSLQARVFKGQTAVDEAKSWLEECEEKIKHIKNEINAGRRESHLQYGFKEYEIPKGPITLPLSSITEDDKRRSWENVTFLQVQAKRIYVTYKRYRKACRSAKDVNRACPVIKHSLTEVKTIMKRIHTERKNWSSKPYEDQQLFISRGRQMLKNLKVTLKVVVKSLKKKRKS